MHKNGFLGAIYATLLSTGQLHKLIELSNKTDMPIRSVQLRTVDAQPQAAAETADA